MSALRLARMHENWLGELDIAPACSIFQTTAG
jgi:hypothetical protein